MEVLEAMKILLILFILIIAIIHLIFIGYGISLMVRKYELSKAMKKIWPRTWFYRQARWM